jgi:peroxiredoxin
MSDTDIEQVETPENDNTIVLQIGWIQVVVGLVVLVGIVGALAAGLWMGRMLSGPSRSSATAGQPIPPAALAPQPVRPVQPQQVVPIQPQPQVQVQPAKPRSSAGVTTSIGRTPGVGDPAPDFTLKNLKGEKISLSDFKGQPVLINFWATWCGPCRIEMPVIDNMYQKYYQDQGFVVLAVDVQESITVVRSFVDSMGLTFPILLDHTGKVADGAYRIRAFPTSYFVGRDGKITAAHRGMMTEPIMQRYMDRVLATQPAAGD